MGKPLEERLHTGHGGNSARTVHEGFYCNRGHAVATGVLATQSIDILFQVCLPSSWLCLPISQCVCPGFVTNPREGCELRQRPESAGRRGSRSGSDSFTDVLLGSHCVYIAA